MRHLRPLVALFLFTLSATLLVQGGWRERTGFCSQGWRGRGRHRYSGKVELASYRPPAKPIANSQIPGPTQQEIELAEEEGQPGSAWVVDS